VHHNEEIRSFIYTPGFEKNIDMYIKSRLGDMYSIQYYVIKFSPGTPVSSTNKTDRHDITDILLKVALNSQKT
jgi:hypothetical protein